jgi:hypothetical protein
MDAQNLKDLEEAIEFGRDISSTLHLLGHTEYIFGSRFGEDMKRRTVADLDSQRVLVQRMIDLVNTKYKGIKAAEEAKANLQKGLARVEEAAHPYL